jgi:hypothetical protein
MSHIGSVYCLCIVGPPARSLDPARQGPAKRPNRETAQQGPYTVRHHVSELIAKLGAANRAEAAAVAVQHKFVE